MFVLSFAWFAVTAEESGIASVFCDPVSRIASQDEAVYGREAIEMAAQGNYLTPTYLGRYVLNKPPLMQLLSAISVRMFGVSAWSVRFPSLLAAAAISALIFSLSGECTRHGRRWWRSCCSIGATCFLFSRDSA